MGQIGEVNTLGAPQFADDDEWAMETGTRRRFQFLVSIINCCHFWGSGASTCPAAVRPTQLINTNVFRVSWSVGWLVGGSCVLIDEV